MDAARLVLASRSPQRRAILEQLGVRFEVEAPDVEEVLAGEPATVVVENALRKARAAASARRGSIVPVLGADTAVVVDGTIHGKPPGPAAARAVIASLSGRWHEVWSGIALLRGASEAETRTAAVATRVRFRSLENAEVEWYVATGEWRDRAGGYAIQGRGAALVEEIAGDYWNVVGLPVTGLVRLLPELARSDRR